MGRSRSRSRDRGREGGGRGGGGGDERTETLEFPRRMMGKVIGKQGATIKDIRAQTGANIQSKEIGDDKCEFTVRGSFDQVDEAKKMILDIVEDDSRSNNNRNGDS